MPKYRQTATKIAVQDATTVSAAAALAVCTVAVSLVGGMMAVAGIASSSLQRPVFRAVLTNTSLTNTSVTTQEVQGGGAGAVGRVDDFSLVAYWPIDERDRAAGIGSVLADTKLPATNIYMPSTGECFGETVFWDETAGAINFTGEHEYFQTCVASTVADANEIYQRIKTTDEFTAEVWFAPANTTDIVDIFSYGNSYELQGNSSNFFIRQNGDDIEFGVRNEADFSSNPNRPDPNPTLRWANILRQNEPTQVVLRWRGTGGSPRVWLDVNLSHTVFSNSTPLMLGSTLNRWSSNYIYLAQKRTIDGVNFKGRVYLAAIYDRALTDAEVGRNFAAGYLPSTCVDNDGDGYGSPGDSSCPAGPAIDCDDNNASRHPGAPEICNAIDDDCDGVIDDGIGMLYCRDADGDGVGDPALTAFSCAQPAGYVPLCFDCNDRDFRVHPFAVDVCDSKDNNCNSVIDEGGNACGGACVLSPAVGTGCDFVGSADLDTCTDDATICDAATTLNFNDTKCANVDTDFDNDGYSACSATCTAWQRCDCNDTQATTWSGAPEVCDGRDNDCNGVIDESCTAFRRGDANTDGKVNMSDVSTITNWYSLGGTRPRCMDAADGNDDGRVDISDAKFIADWYASGGRVPPLPGPFTKGLDPTADQLDCLYYP